MACNFITLLIELKKIDLYDNIGVSLSTLLIIGLTCLVNFTGFALITFESPSQGFFTVFSRGNSWLALILSIVVSVMPQLFARVLLFWRTKNPVEVARFNEIKQMGKAQKQRNNWRAVFKVKAL